jgi:protein SCO1/2
MAVIAAAAIAGLSPAALAHDGHHHHAASEAAATLQRSTQRFEVPDARLVDTAGHAAAAREVLEAAGPTLVNFVFTSCTAICPVMSATFARLQHRLGDESAHVRLVSISIDPEHDTPERLAEYARRFDARPGWEFFTGTAAASLSLQQAFDVYRGDKMGHDPVTFMRAAAGEPWIRLDGFASVEQLLEEYRRLRKH